MEWLYNKRGRIHGFNGSSGLWLFAEMKAGILLFSHCYAAAHSMLPLGCFQQKVHDKLLGNGQRAIKSPSIDKVYPASFSKCCGKTKENASNTKIFKRQRFLRSWIVICSRLDIICDRNQHVHVNIEFTLIIAWRVPAWRPSDADEASQPACTSQSGHAEIHRAFAASAIPSTRRTSTSLQGHITQ
jgi:hypothetical protein